MRSRAILTLLVVSLAGAPSASGSVSAGHSGWQWGSPLPQGHAIKALQFQSNVGYAVGDFGTVLATGDGGATWAGLATGVTSNLDLISVIDADSLVVAGGCTLRRSDDGGATFRRLPWNGSGDRCGVPIAALVFPTELRGFLVLADGSLLRTDDGGSTWLALPPIPASGPTAIAFTAPDVGVVATGAGLIYRTGDGGATWQAAGLAARGLRSIFFVTAQHGYAVGERSTVMETLNGGKTWSAKGADGSPTLASIRCETALICLAASDAGGLLRTSDGGKTFTQVEGSEGMFAVGFAAGSRAVAAGAAGQVLASDDSGATWTRVGGRLDASLVRLSAISPKVAFAAGREGLVAGTSDGGRTWHLVGSAGAQDLTDVSFGTAKLGYALDLPGHVLRTTDGGVTWRRLTTGFPAGPQAVLALGSRVVLLIGPHRILRSRNGGRTFTTARGSAAREAKLFEIDRAGRALVAYGSRRIAMSVDGGRSWKRVRRPRHALVAAVDFATARTGFLLEQDGRLWRTDTRGRGWHDLPGTGTDDGTGLAFSSPKRGYLTLSKFGDDRKGYLLRTSDGGRTWRPQLVTTSSIDPDGIAARGATDFALTADGSLFFTTSGGDEGRPSGVTLSTPRRHLRGRHTIHVTGTVRGAAPGSTVLVSRRFRGDSGWDHRSAALGTDGRFTTTWLVTRSTTFVAQWKGDDDQAGGGSRPVRVIVRP